MTASVDALTNEIAATIDKWLWSGGQNGPVIAAWAVLTVPDIADGLRALRVVSRLMQAHQERRWSDDSPSSTCTCGRGWPCDVRQLLADP